MTVLRRINVYTARTQVDRERIPAKPVGLATIGLGGVRGLGGRGSKMGGRKKLNRDAQSHKLHIGCLQGVTT